MDQDQNTVGRSPDLIPQFEGKDVGLVKVKLTSASGLEYPKVLRHGAVAKLVVEVRCVGVDHPIDPKTGDLVRVQNLRVIDAVPLAWFQDLLGQQEFGRP